MRCNVVDGAASALVMEDEQRISHGPVGMPAVKASHWLRLRLCPDTQKRSPVCDGLDRRIFVSMPEPHIQAYADEWKRELRSFL